MRDMAIKPKDAPTLDERSASATALSPSLRTATNSLGAPLLARKVQLRAQRRAAPQNHQYSAAVRQNPDSGSSGGMTSAEEVSAAQRQLRRHGHRIPVDGVLRPQTLRALRAFQRAHGLAADGILGSQTQAALEGPVQLPTPVPRPERGEPGENPGQPPSPHHDEQPPAPHRDEQPPASHRDPAPAEREGTFVAPELGTLSAHYESNGDPGTVSSGSGDAGGVSYGAYQMTSKGGGTVAQYVVQSRYAAEFAGMQPGSAAFSRKWKEIARREPEEFRLDQHEFIKRTHYDVLAERLKGSLGIDLALQSTALRQVIWSVAVQHGGKTTLVEDAVHNHKVEKSPFGFYDDDLLIEAIYAERGRKDEAGNLVRFKKNSKKVQEGVANRFQKENRQALGLWVDENLHDGKGAFG